MISSEMADSAAAHLEKMGRELKCPICLSLLKSAASLTCNHMFCNFCITESMRSDSHCPVCKVPFSRREIRPAPHMDNLVNIYKSMEVASGINIFVSQNGHSTKPSVPEAEKKQVEGEQDSGKTKKVGKRRRGKVSKKRVVKEVMKTDERTSDSQLSMNPSFPAKKRVHVPQGNPFETPLRTKRTQENLTDQAKKQCIDSSTVLKEKSASDAKKETVLSPFFWLREDDGDSGDVERLTNQQMDIDNVTDTPPIIPSFSDIKDTDDCSPTKLSPKGKVSTPSKLMNVFDSEMFEWTQRACSPEIFSTPVKDKVVYQSKLDGFQEAEPVLENAKDMTAEQVNRKANMKFSSPKSNDIKVQSGRKTPNNQHGGNSGNKRKCGKASVDKGVGEVTLNSVSEGLFQGRKSTVKAVALNPRKKNNQSNKKAIPATKTMKGVAEDVGAPSNEVNIQNLKKNVSDGSTELPVDNLGFAGNLNHKRTESRKCISKYQMNLGEGSKNQVANTAVSGVLKEVSINQNQLNKNVKIQAALVPCKQLGKNKASALKDKISVKKNISNTQKKGLGELRKCITLKKCSDGGAAKRLSHQVLDGAAMVSAKKKQTTPEHKEDPQVRNVGKSEPTKKVLSADKSALLQKCGGIQGPNCCAFCQSSTDSEFSGKMMHYFNGKPVAPDFNGGSNIIHSHKNCTEWAPNVYFEDDAAINLESELARSRRIKCSCCGVKGAALGCYEKTCRKSFHVTCAKLVSGCRWDTENFVMLCPFHPSSKLPNELTGPQRKKQKQSLTTRESQGGHQAEVMVQDGLSTAWSWKGSANKWVLCCSAVTEGEKEVVSKFTKMAGAQLLQTFGPSVTHIIASTDENGACRRTLKVLMGILEGKWILTIDWVKACMEAKEPVAEEGYEIGLDIHGTKGGPNLGRQRVLNKQPKLFDGIEFYFIGEFLASYKGYLQDLIIAAGGTVLHRKPVSGDNCVTTTFIIYNIELPDNCDSGKKKKICDSRRKEAEELASLNDAKVAAHTWLLNSIAACKLQSL